MTAAVALLVIACSVDLVPSQPAPSANPIATRPTPSPAATPVRTFPPSNVSFTVVPSTRTLRVGEPVEFEATLANLGQASIVYDSHGCFAQLKIGPVLVGAGRTWSGKAAAFKDLVLSSSFPRDASDAAVVSESVPTVDCPQPVPNRSWLLEGERVTAHFRWDGASYAGLPARPGEVRYDASVAVFRFDQVVAGQNFSDLTASGALTRHGSKRGYISAAEAIDAALADARFRRFVDAQPEGTCATASVGLSSWPSGAFLPPGPNWDVELICDHGVPRHYALIGINPVTAEIRGLYICREPCWR